MEYLYIYLTLDSNPAKRVSFITEGNASMICQLKLEVLKIDVLCICVNKVLSYFIPSPTTKGVTKYETLFDDTQHPLLYSHNINP